MDRRSILFALLGGIVAVVTARNALASSAPFPHHAPLSGALDQVDAEYAKNGGVMVWAFDAAADSIRAGGLAVVSDVVSGAAEQGTGTAVIAGAFAGSGNVR
jgi:hypothetical protein